jgi:virginiamycin B lyase
MSSRTIAGLTFVALVLPTLTAAQGGARGDRPAESASPYDLREWAIPWGGSRPRDPFPDRDGRIWFVGEAGNYVARFDTKSSEFKRFEIDAGTNPRDVVIANGAVWFTGTGTGRIVKMDASTGTLRRFKIPDSTIVRDPHAIVVDTTSGIMWFTADSARTVGRFDPATGGFMLWNMKRGARPDGIALDSRGRPWFAEFGTNTIGMIDPTARSSQHYPLPDSLARPRRIGVTSDDAVWYGDYRRGYVGRLDPATGSVEEFAMPSGADSRPYGLTVDDRDVVWIAETGVSPNRLVAFDTKRRTWGPAIAVGDGAPNAIAHMAFDRQARQLWFVTQQGTIGRISVPPKGAAP